MKRLAKVIGVILLLIAMGYLTRYDMPKYTNEALADVTYYVEVEGERYYGRFINGRWYEPTELYQEAIILEQDHDE